MRILQILPELNVGGVETGTVDFAKYLVENGHESVVVSNGGTLVAKLLNDGSKHYQLPVHKKSLGTAFRLVKKVREIILKEKIEIVHARSRVPAWIAYFACRKTQALFITTCHGFYRHRIYSQVMGWPKTIIVPSEAIARHMIDHYKISSENIRCIPRSVDLDRFNPDMRKIRHDGICTIAIIGRLTPLKGHPFFLQAMAKVVRQVPYARFGSSVMHRQKRSNTVRNWKRLRCGWGSKTMLNFWAIDRTCLSYWRRLMSCVFHP